MLYRVLTGTSLLETARFSTHGDAWKKYGEKEMMRRMWVHIHTHPTIIAEGKARVVCSRREVREVVQVDGARRLETFVRSYPQEVNLYTENLRWCRVARKW